MHFILVIAFLLIGPLYANSDLSGQVGKPTGKTIDQQGSFDIMIYNIAGLPQIIAPIKDPKGNHQKISPLLKGPNVVLLQEDFYYHEHILKHKKHFYNSDHIKAKFIKMGDGLARVTDLVMKDHKRQKWSVCEGILTGLNDCLATKGYELATHSLQKLYAIEADIYNLHMDAGDGKNDQKVRRKQLEQLVVQINTNSKDRPVIVGGDFNLNNTSPYDEESWKQFLEKTNLADACKFSETTAKANCNAKERLDRIAYRGSENIRLQVLKYQLVKEKFVDKDGKDLSDHLPVYVTDRKFKPTTTSKL